MKKLALLSAMLVLMSFSAKAQWFDFSNNSDRAVVGVQVGLVGYESVNKMSTDELADLGVGLNFNFAGFYLDFNYVVPEHRFDSHVVQQNWDDHNALVINVGYQIPIYKNYVFVTPLIGWSRVTTGYTEGNNIGIDTENHSIYHKYVVEWSRNDFNYGGGLTIVPCKWFEINGVFTSHAVYGGIGFNLNNYKK